MRWNVEIKEVPYDGGYQFFVKMEIDDRLAKKLVDQKTVMAAGTQIGERGPTIAEMVRDAIPWMEGHASTRQDVYDEIKDFIIEQETKHPKTVLKEVVEL
jgi:hypothetical protein